MSNKVNIITSGKNWMESTAVSQLDGVANLPGVLHAVGLPDLHAGKSPVGIAVETQGVFYPQLIGNDIGCGMGLFQTGIPLNKYKPDRWVTKLNHIRTLGDIPTANPYPEESPIFDLGTIGGGNHFAEFQRVEETLDPAAVQSLGVAEDAVLLLVHSGSRGYGQRILGQFSDYHGLQADSEDAKEYLRLHDDALLWAKRNRLLAAQKLIGHLGFAPEPQTILDCYHNFLQKMGGGFLHRKGAVSALDGLVILPGSRGSLTYILKPAENTEASLFSLSHGAGRKWARSLCKSRIRDKYDRDSIRSTKLKSLVLEHAYNPKRFLWILVPAFCTEEKYQNNISGLFLCIDDAHDIILVQTLHNVCTKKISGI